MTLAINIGSWGGFYWNKSSLAARLCLGFVAVTLWFRDLDFLMDEMLGAEEI